MDIILQVVELCEHVGLSLTWVVGNRIGSRSSQTEYQLGLGVNCKTSKFEKCPTKISHHCKWDTP